MSVKIGDRVRFLNTLGGGTVKKIDSGIAHVEDDDGFVTPVLLKEIVVVAPAVPSGGTFSPVAQTIVDSIEWNTPPAEPEPHEHELPPFEETPEGEKLNVVITFIPQDIHRLSETGYETYIVNDSNYWLSFIYMSRGRNDDEWILRATNTIEPGTQLFLEDVDKSQLNTLERIRVQILAYKQDKPFTAKVPYDIEERLDVTKFLKLHCFRPSIYFDEDVLMVELIKNDKSVRMREAVDANALRDGMMEKKNADMRPAARRIKKRPIENDPLAPLVVDLHIEELVDNTRGMSAADMLNRQIDEFRAVMDQHRAHKGKKIVFIHGKGEGVLRNALLKELNHQYKGNIVQDASFREYGFGATQVIIR